jgi:hypothetical protein
MRNRKGFQKDEILKLENKYLINKIDGNFIYEVKNEVTSDLAEFVSILIREVDYSDPVWNIGVFDIVLEDLSPEKSLFWLTGGHKEWKSLENYNKPWHLCYLEFQEEFGFMVIRSVKKAKKLGDIRDSFLRYLNLPVLYDFAISKGLVR